MQLGSDILDEKNMEKLQRIRKVRILVNRAKDRGWP